MFKKGLIAGLANLVVGFGYNFLLGILLPNIAKEYELSGIFRPWSDPLMMAFYLAPLISGIAIAYLWQKLDKPKPVDLANIYLLIVTLPGMFITYTSFNVSFAMVLTWIISGYLQVLVAGFVFTKLKN